MNEALSTKYQALRTERLFKVLSDVFVSSQLQPTVKIYCNMGTLSEEIWLHLRLERRKFWPDFSACNSKDMRDEIHGGGAWDCNPAGRYTRKREAHCLLYNTEHTSS